nr:C1 family peptidase [Candidatus Njordarchaeota archaeon]
MTEKLGMGWLPDYPDFRDYTIDRNEVSPRLLRVGQEDSVKAMLTKAGVVEPVKVALPDKWDLKAWCSPIENQGSLGSCTAHAAVGLVEYFETRAFGQYMDASRLFLYKATRNMLHWTGDTGAYLRTTMGALVLFGVPPEEYWPYTIADFEKEPPAFCYSFAQNYQAICYYRLDPPLTPRKELLTRVKTFLGAGLPSMFGFTVYSSYTQASTTGKIPFPTSGERVVGGHAVAAIGYDDSITIENRLGGTPTVGALLIRNSWGTGWGVQGYGWLPYEYVLRGLAVDWWSLLRNEWINTEIFKLRGG